MLQPEDLAACVWLVATAPPRAVIDEISLSSR
jgi:NADP-dependent 3-hydroxy acid dehydrogenase YdfG